MSNCYRAKIVEKWAKMCHYFCATKNVPLLDVQRAPIVVRHEEGYSERAISQKIKKSKNAVHN